jgi:hypothetical protein
MDKPAVAAVQLKGARKALKTLHDIASSLLPDVKLLSLRLVFTKAG